MLLHLIFIQCISLASAGQDIFSTLLKDSSPIEDSYSDFTRFARHAKKSRYVDDHLTCEQLTQTTMAPFVVHMLYKSSGHFLGLGSILDKKTILTAADIVEQSMKIPSTLLVLAGRLTAWWGKDSQVRQAREIYQNDVFLAIVILKDEITYSKYIRPIDIPTGPVPEEFTDVFDRHWVIFGIPRSSWDIPGDTIPKTNIYLTRVESVTMKKPDSDACKATYPSVEFNDTVMECTFANGTFGWGCKGSPTLALSPTDGVVQIGVLIKATLLEADEFHIHVKVGFFEQWIRSLSLFGFKKK